MIDRIIRGRIASDFMGVKPAAISEAMKALLNPSKLGEFIGSIPPTISTDPKTFLLHVKFAEDEPQTAALADYLWAQCMYYALPRKRRLAFEAALKTDITMVARVHQAVRDVFIKFNAEYPSRASELGEVLAYCVVQHHLSAAQVAAKMALKTSANMPIHGLDGIHATYENDALTIYFLESKLSVSANAGAKDYAESASQFLANRKQYLREYEIVSDLGHLDSLTGAARDAALEYFDIWGKPTLPRRERCVGVICYSETKTFADKIPVSNGPVDAHEKHFQKRLAEQYNAYQAAALKHIKEFGGKPDKSLIFFVAVPEVNELRKLFYESTGLPASALAKTTKKNSKPKASIPSSKSQGGSK